MNFKKQIIALCCLTASLAAQTILDPRILEEVQLVVSSSEELLIKREQCQARNCAGFQDGSSGLMELVHCKFKRFTT